MAIFYSRSAKPAEILIQFPDDGTFFAFLPIPKYPAETPHLWQS
jgi:hypothetical protein